MSTEATCAVWNPKMFIKVGDNGKEITTGTLQFDINLGPGQKAIFVNANNEGICEIELADGRKVNGQPQWFLISDSGGGIYGKLSVIPEIRDGANNNQLVKFRVRDNYGSTGTVNLDFKVEYK